MLNNTCVVCLFVRLFVRSFVCYFAWWSNSQQRGFPLRKYFIPGCVGKGLDLSLRVCPSSSPSPPPASSGNLGFCPLAIEVEKQGFRTAWEITSQKFQGVGLKLKASILTFRDPASHWCQKNHERGWLNRFEVGGLLQYLGFFKTQFIDAEFWKWGANLFTNLNFPISHIPSIQNERI